MGSPHSPGMGLLPRSLHVAVLIINDYLESNNREVFTYNGLKAHASRLGLYRRYDITDRTLDRAVRKLVEYGLLDRIVSRRDRRLVFFKPTERFHEYISMHVERWLVDDESQPPRLRTGQQH